MVNLAREVGGPEAAANLLAGKGIGIILKSISVDFKRPVVYPDTVCPCDFLLTCIFQQCLSKQLFISHRPRPMDPPSETHFNNDAIIYSYSQQKVIATSQSVLVWYDYNNLKKVPPTEAMRAALARRMEP